MANEGFHDPATSTNDPDPAAGTDAASGLVPVNPIPGAALEDSYGYPRAGGRLHLGIDIFAPHGTQINAAMGGTITQVRGPGHDPEGQLGERTITIAGDDGRHYYYAHNRQTSSTPATW